MKTNSADGELAAASREPISRRVGLAIVAILTLAGFVLRLLEIDQSLMGDELLTYRIVTENSLWDTFRLVTDTEISPPLYFVLTWAAVQFGNPSVWIHVPSLVLGTATVPLVYALGLRTVGRSAALVGSALVAILPFAIFFGVESRAYAMLTFLSALSTLALLRAMRHGGLFAWATYGVSAAAILYTHYTGVWVLLGQVGWALWADRGRVRQLALVYAAVALAYVPWLPSYFGRSDDVAGTKARQLVGRFPLSADTIAEMVGHVLPGYPLLPPGSTYLPLREVPGRPVVAVVWVTIGAALVGAIVRVWRRRRAGLPVAPSRTSVLIVVLTLATPLGLILYSAQPDKSLLLSRNLSPSLPAFALLVGLLLTSLERRFAIAATGLVLAALVVGTARTLDDDYQRPPYRQAAHFIDDAARPGDPVVHPLLAGTEDVAIEPLTPHFERAHDVLSIANGSEITSDEERLVRQRAVDTERVFVAVSQSISRTGEFWRHLLGKRLSLEAHHVYPGGTPIAVFEYVRTGGPAIKLSRRNGRDVILRSGRAALPVGSPAGAGFLDVVRNEDHELTVAGWAVDKARHLPARLVLAFYKGRVVVTGRPWVQRDDIAKAYGSPLGLSGFNLITSREDAEELARPSGLKVVAISGRRAWQLPPTPTTFGGGS